MPRRSGDVRQVGTGCTQVYTGYVHGYVHGIYTAFTSFAALNGQNRPFLTLRTVFYACFTPFSLRLHRVLYSYRTECLIIYLFQGPREYGGRRAG